MNKLFVIISVMGLFCGCGNGLLSDDNDVKSGNDVNSVDELPPPDNVHVNCTDCLPTVDDQYIYTIVPGTDEWKNLTSPDGMDKACLLPDDVLKSISTTGLIRGLMDMPTLWFYYYASSNGSPVGTSYRVYERHNSVQELKNRKDRASALYNYYKSVCFDCFAAIDPLSIEDAGKEMRLYAQLTTLHVLFTLEEITGQFIKTEKQDLVTLLLQHAKSNIRLGTLEVIAIIMHDDGYAPVVDYLGKNLDKEWFLPTQEQVKAILSFAEKYILK